MGAWDEARHIAERRHGVLTTRDLLGAGLSRRQIDALSQERRLVSIGRAVWRVGGAPDTYEAAVLGAILGVDCLCWASHHTAARLWDLPVHGPPGLIDVTRVYGTSASRGALRIHRSTRVPDHHVTVVRHVPITTVSRTLFDLARTTGPKVFDRAVEAALRTPRCTVGSLYRVLNDLGGRGRPGTRRMRAALASRDTDYIPTSSELTAVGRALVAHVPGIRWEVPLSDDQGYIRRVDAYVQEAKVVIEFDGVAHHDQPSDAEADAAGDDRLEALGIVVERLRWLDVTRRADASRALIDRLVATGRLPTAPAPVP